MISKQEKYKRVIQRPDFLGGNKTRAWQKKLQFSLRIFLMKIMLQDKLFIMFYVRKLLKSMQQAANYYSVKCKKTQFFHFFAVYATL